MSDISLDNLRLYDLMTQSRTSILSLPVELIFSIFRDVRRLIGQRDFKHDAWGSMKAADEYMDNLLAFALTYREWTTVAQSELLKNMILSGKPQTERLIGILKGSEVLREYARAARQIRFGQRHQNYDGGKFNEMLNEIALYCPNVVEISCSGVPVRLEYFREIKKLDKLNLYGGSLLAPRTTDLQPGSTTISCSLLSLDHLVTSAPNSISSTSLPLLRSLYLCFRIDPPYLPPLPQLTSLYLPINPSNHVYSLLRLCPSVTFLSVREVDIKYLDQASCTAIRNQIQTLKLITSVEVIEPRSLRQIIRGNKILKKVVVDGIYVPASWHASRLSQMGYLREMCKKMDIEIWKVRFTINGKANLDSEELDLFGGELDHIYMDLE